MKNSIYIFCILFCVFGFVGCSLSSSAPSGAMNFYELKRLESDFLGQKNSLEAGCVKWRVGSLEVADKIAGVRISYKRSKNEIAYFAANSWVSPLEKMLPEIVYGAIYGGCNVASNKNVADFMLNLPKNAKGVEIYVLDFYYDEPSNSAVVRILLRFNNSAHEIERKVLVGGAEFVEIIKAMNIALWEAFVESSKWKF